MLALCIATSLTFGLAIPSQAATTADVTVTAQPRFISISTTQGTWTINGITGDGYIDPSTTYYSNPLGDTTAPSATVLVGETYFPISNSSSVDITLTVDMGDFSGGADNMTNSGTGTAGATAYGAKSYYTGSTLASAVVVETTGSDVLWTSSSPGDDIGLGVIFYTQTNAWTGAASSTATLTVTAAAAP